MHEPTVPKDRAAAALEQIAALLADWHERLPARQTVDWSVHSAGRWHQDALGGWLAPVQRPATATLNDLRAIDRQRERLVTNTKQFLAGFPANNVLLTGSRGAGKSSLVQGLLAEFEAQGLRMIQVEKNQLRFLPDICAQIEAQPFRFIIFCDDLSFDEDDDGYKVLKSLLEGSLERPAGHCLIYATSNRRHLLPERPADNAATRLKGDELHESEATEEKISLSDRFGLWLSFYPMRQVDYLTVVRHWLERLLSEHDARALLPQDLSHDRCPVLLEALAWARGRGHRSGRAAHHFARQWVGERLLERTKARS